jgi:hypothetical protein
MARKKVRSATEIMQPALDLSPAVEGSLAVARAPGGAEGHPSVASMKSLPPLTKAQVHYWRELCGVLTQAGKVGVPSADDFPPDLAPSRATLNAMVERGILVRRQRAWHLTRAWYARLTALRLEAVDTPQLRVSERPSPGLPSYAELQAWEAICRWLDTQPRQRARLPFMGFTAFVVAQTTPLPAFGEVPEMPAALLRGMRRARIVRHTSACEWVLSRVWRERLRVLWHGFAQLQREVTAATGATGAQARSLVAGIDTWVLNWRTEEALPARLRKELDDSQAQAREEDAELDTRWVFDQAPLRMYRWGTKPEHGGGVSWSYVMLNPSLRLLIRKAPLGGISAQARLGANCLWRMTPRRALDELDALVRRLWGKTSGHWQVSQVHLAHDVANAPILADWRDRFVSRSRSRAQYEASRQQLEELTRMLNGGDDEDALPWGVDWDAQYALDKAALGWDPFVPVSHADQEENGDPFEEDAEDREVTQYTTGQRLSGLTWSAGGPISVVLYRKDWEIARRGKAYMEPLWQASGWQHGEPVTRCEARLRREALRVLRLPNLPDSHVLDHPWTMLEHLEALFATVVGQAEEACPDMVNVSWLRLVVSSEDETNPSRWETDPAWRVIQAARFTDAPPAARRLIRRIEHKRCAEQLDGILYGLLVRRVAELHPDGETWDVSRALGDVVPALEELAAQPDKDFGPRVRQRRQQLGLPVAPAGRVLPLRASQPPLEPSEALVALDAEPPETELERAIWRVRLAERRMREAYLALEEAEQRGGSLRELERLADVFAQESEGYGAALAAQRTGVDGSGMGLRTDLVKTQSGW